MLLEEPGRPRGRLLVDADGQTVGRFEQHDRDGTPLADLFEPAAGVSRERAAEVLLRELRGWRVAGDEPFGRPLVAAGGRPVRHAHVMSRDLVREPAPRAWLSRRCRRACA